MKGKGGLRRYFRLPLSAATLERDIEEEMAFHLEMRTRELEQEGLEPAEAEAIAQREYGDVREARAELTKLGRSRIRSARMTDLRDVLGQDVRWALRMLVREPAFSLAVVLALGVGVGVNAVMFSVTDRLLLRAPPGIESADHVGRVFFHASLDAFGAMRQPVTTWPQFENLRTVPVLADAGAFTAVRTESLGRGRDARPVAVVLATGSLFTTLGTRPHLGRFFTDEESRAGNRVAVVSRPFWEGTLAGASLDGVRVRVGREEYDVIGVAPAGYTGVYLEPVDIWLPLGTAGPEMGGDGWNTASMQWLQIAARRGDGVTLAAAEAALSAAARKEDWLLQADTASRVTLESVVPARGLQPAWSAGARAGRVALWLSAICLIVLLIACANVANLLLARASRRRREIGVRLALGIGRARLAWQLLVETLVLAAAAGLVALFLATWTGTVLRRMLLPDVEWAGRPVLDARMLLFAAAIIGVAVVLTGLAPALYAVRDSVLGALGLGVRGGGGGRTRLRSALVVVQTALSVMLLVGAAAFVLSLRNLRQEPLGFEPRGLVAVRWPAGSLELSREERLALYEESLQRLRALPAVHSAALAAVAPFTGSISVSIEREDESRDDGRGVYMNAISADYLDVIGTRVLRGRDFTLEDAAGGEPVVIVTRALAADLWPGADPLARCLRWERSDGACARVVGVIEDPRMAGAQGADIGRLFLVPIAQHPTVSADRALVVRLRTGGVSLRAVREALQTVRPGLPHVHATSYDELISPFLRPWQLGARLFTALGILALALATLGLYGVIAYDVTQRQQEMSVRVALGARASAIVRMVMGDAGRLVAAGVIFGALGAILAADRLQPLLYGVSAREPFVLAVAVVLLGIAGMSAAALPARRAARADPIRALREQ
jgi:putative ABC transport system permease protein